MKGIIEIVLLIALGYVIVDPKEFGSTVGTIYRQVEAGFSEGYRP